MTQRTIRRGLAVGAGVAAAALTFTSTAYACTTFVGTMTVTGDNNTKSAVVGKGVASGGGHEYCRNPDGGAVGHGPSPGIAGSILTIAVSPAAPCTVTTLLKLVDGDHFVQFAADRDGYQKSTSGQYSNFSSTNASNLCMNTGLNPGIVNLNAPGTTTPAKIAVRAGTGTVQVQLPVPATTNTVGNESSICIAARGDGDTGIMAPIFITV